jgi:ATP-dependent DNA helicase RecG
MLNAKMLSLLAFSRMPRDRVSIQKHLKLKDEKNVRARYLKPLIEAGLLELTDLEHPTSRAQKYRTMDLGLTILRVSEED